MVAGVCDIHSHEAETGHFLLCIQSGTPAQRIACIQGGSSHPNQHVLGHPLHMCLLDDDLSKLTIVTNHHKESRAMPGSKDQVIGWASVIRAVHVLGCIAGQKVWSLGWMRS